MLRKSESTEKPQWIAIYTEIFCCIGNQNIIARYLIFTSSIVPDDEFEKQPLAGSVFIIKDVGVRGTEMVSYAG